MKYFAPSTIIYVKYLPGAFKYSGVKEETLALDIQMTIDELLFNIFEKYPKLFEKAVPGTLIQKVNGALAYPNYVLQTGDLVEYDLISLGEFRDKLRQDLKKKIEKNKLPFSVEDVELFVLESNEDDIKDLIPKFLQGVDISINELDETADLLVKIWNSFPQKRLKGKSQMQAIHQDLLNDLQGIKEQIKKEKHDSNKT